MARSSTGAAARRAGDPVLRLLLGSTALLAVIAVVVVVMGEDERVLRLGVIAGLWAALLAVAALVRRGRSPDEAEVAAREEALRRTYELELAAEIDARREHELTVEQTLRSRIAAENGEEIAALRAELARLRASLETGAAAARMRALPVAPVAGPLQPPAPRTGGRSVADLLAAHANPATEERRRPR